MRWRGRRQSTNVEDRRGLRPATGFKLGGAALLVVIVLALATGEDPLRLLELGGDGTALDTGGAPAGLPGTPAGDEQSEFVAVVLADTEETWQPLLAAYGAVYLPPTLVLFSDAVDSACGSGSAAVGPFYCPGDRKVYIDLTFFAELDRRYGAPGDFAQAYVIAHEVGHHVQQLLGISDQFQRMRARVDEVTANALSVRVELQADCFAGVWGHHAGRRGLLEAGDLEEGLAAAAAIGDDTLQRRARGRVQPDAFTHGTSEQRVRWFRRGFDSGSADLCDTFDTDDL